MGGVNHNAFLAKLGKIVEDLARLFSQIPGGANAKVGINRGCVAPVGWIMPEWGKKIPGAGD